MLEFGILVLRMSANDNLTPSQRAGILWLLLLFSATPILMLFFDYSASTTALTHVRIGMASFALSFAVMAILHWLSQLVKYTLPDAWFRFREVESVRLYRQLGVGLFRTFLLKSPFRSLNTQIHLNTRKREALRELDTHMRNSEANHVIAFVITLLATLAYGYFNDGRFFFWLSVFNVLGNVYPVLLQRYNRIRLARLIK